MRNFIYINYFDIFSIDITKIRSFWIWRYHNFPRMHNCLWVIAVYRWRFTVFYCLTLVTDWCSNLWTTSCSYKLDKYHFINASKFMIILVMSPLVYCGKSYEIYFRRDFFCDLTHARCSSTYSALRITRLGCLISPLEYELECFQIGLCRKHKEFV